MAKFANIVMDCPWNFKDSLSQSSTKRGASANYTTMSNADILALPVEDIAADNAILACWVPSSFLTFGLECMKKWGFEHKQTLTWVKVKKSPLEDLMKTITKKTVKGMVSIKDVRAAIADFDINTIVSCFMGRLFRQTHEVIILGVKGKIYSDLQNKSQRSVFFAQNLKHSSKPEIFQDRLDLMFPDYVNGKLLFANKKVELFGRRNRSKWIVCGNESALTPNEDIKISIQKLIDLKDPVLTQFNTAIQANDVFTMINLWKAM